MKNRKLSFMVLVLMMLNLMQVFAFAGSYDVWLTPFESLINTMISFLGIIGKALLAWAIFEVATALFSHDTSQMPQALRKIGGGTLLICISTIIEAMSGGSGGAEVNDSAMMIIDMFSMYA